MTSKRRRMNDLAARSSTTTPTVTVTRMQSQSPSTSTQSNVIQTSANVQRPKSPLKVDTKPTAINKNSVLLNTIDIIDTNLNTNGHTLKLLTRLNSMRDDPALCDYEIRVNGFTYNVHKCLLMAISDFFKVMLTGSMKESRENYVDLKGFNTHIGVEAIINFAYTSYLHITFDNIIYILDAASHLQVHDVIELCTDYLLKNLNKSNCVNILKITDRFALNKVDLLTKEFITKNFVDVFVNGGDQFIQFTPEQLISQLNNDSLQVYSELDLFFITVKWINADKTNRLQFAAKLMSYIRFMTITPYELADHVETIDFMRTIPECYQYLIDAYRYHSLKNRQPLIDSERTKFRNQNALIGVGETSIFVLNEVKQKWEVICTAPLDENYPYPFSTLAINNYLYVLGTRRTASEEYRSCYRFSPRTLEWTQLAPLLHDRSRFGAARLGNYIYVFGGFEGFKRSNRVYLNTVERYSLENDTWELYSSEGPQMSNMAACTHNNLIYYGGGKNINWSKVSDFYCLNVCTMSIEKKANMLTARTTHQITLYDERIIVLGGFDDAGNGILSIESYNIDHDQWTVITNIPGCISKTWPQSLGVLNGKFYISVFHTPNTFKITQKGYYYDINANVWTEAPVIHERARYCPTCCLTFPRKILNFNDNLNNLNIVTDEKEDDGSGSCGGNDTNNNNNPLTQVIDDAIISTLGKIKQRSMSISSDTTSIEADNVNNQIAQDAESLDMSLTSNP